MTICFCNGSNYDDNLIIKELLEEFKGQFTCLGENTEKYITVSIPVEKELAKMENKRDVTYQNLLAVQNL